MKFDASDRVKEGSIEAEKWEANSLLAINFILYIATSPVVHIQRRLRVFEQLHFTFLKEPSQ
jgi:hypothetical protein